METRHWSCLSAHMLVWLMSDLASSSALEELNQARILQTCTCAVGAAGATAHWLVPRTCTWEVLLKGESHFCIA